MARSMTGFGRGEGSRESRKVIVEIKSVNHRYLDMAVKLPRKLNSFEAFVRNYLKSRIQRGKVDVFVSYEDLTESNLSLRYNPAVAAEYWRYLEQMAGEFGIANDVQVSVLSRYPDVLVMEERQEDEEELGQLLEEALGKACDQFVAARETEGAHLKSDLLAKLDEMLVYVEYIEKRSPEILMEYRKKLEGKVQELLKDSQLEESRIAAEVILYADKICVDEETVRLRSHMEHTKTVLQGTDSVGRKLDFIAQEMNREANTILSKANDLEISNYAIELKTGIEKVREQIQNIE